MPRHRTPERIIEDQVQLWSLQRQAAPERARSLMPVITISRSFGALGDSLGRELAEHNGFAVWDRDLVQAVADASGGDARIMASLDERRRNAIDDAVRGFLRGLDHTNTQYFRALVRVIRTISEHGNAIIVGRGANYLVSQNRAFRVRVTAPVAWRVERFAARSGMTMHEAKEHVKRMDDERQDFVAHYFRRDITDPTDYDLVLNAESFPVASMVEIIDAAYSLRFEEAG
jgi:cytidylate kinase